MKKILLVLAFLSTTTCYAYAPVTRPIHHHPSNYTIGYNQGYHIGYNNGKHDQRETIYKAAGGLILLTAGVLLIYNLATSSDVKVNDVSHLTYKF